MDGKGDGDGVGVEVALDIGELLGVPAPENPELPETVPVLPSEGLLVGVGDGVNTDEPPPAVTAVMVSGGTVVICSLGLVVKEVLDKDPCRAPKELPMFVSGEVEAISITAPVALVGIVILLGDDNT